MKELQLPALPPGAPSHLEHLLSELVDAFELETPATAYRALQKTFHFLLGFYADLGQHLSSVFGDISFPKASSDPENAEAALGVALKFLTTDAPQELSEVSAFNSVFYQGEVARKHSKAMNIGGKPRRGYVSLARFAKASTPTGKKCTQEIRRYLPLLDEWLQASTSLFSTAEVARERQQQITLKVNNQELPAGPRLNLDSCPLCAPHQELDVPASMDAEVAYLFVPQRCPEVLLEMTGSLADALEQQDPVVACLYLRNTLEFLIRYFAGVTARASQELSILGDESQALLSNSRDLGDCEKLLVRCLDSLGEHAEDLTARSLVGVFYNKDQSFEVSPRAFTAALFEGRLSSWCLLEPGYSELEDPQACKREFARQLPLLREWLLRMAWYLHNSEHFFKEAAEDGSVEFSVRLGDRILEVGGHDYKVWLNNPRALNKTSPTTQEGARRPLIREPLEPPRGCPPRLKGILTRLDLYLRLGEPVEACTSLSDAFDYMMRLCAGLAVAAVTKQGNLPEEAARLCQQSDSEQECERLLILALRTLGADTAEPLGQQLHKMFFYRDEDSNEERPTGGHTRLLQKDADPGQKSQQLAEFCSLRNDPEALSNPARCKREIVNFLPILRDWLATAESLLARCRFQESDGKSEGALKLVATFKETEYVLAEPDFHFRIRPGAAQEPDIEVPELPPEEVELDEDFLQEPEPEDPPFLMHRVMHVGERENSQGQMCQSGYIVITNAGGGTLAGTAVSTHDALEVSPRRFRGNRVELSYWLNEEELPVTHDAFIMLHVPGQETSVSVTQMRRKTEADRTSPTRGLLKVLAPMLLGLLLFAGAYGAGVTYIHQNLSETLGPNYVLIDLLEVAPAARASYLGIAQMLAYFYLLLGGLLPILMGTVYRRLPEAVTAQLDRRLKVLLLLPLGLTLLLVLPLWMLPLAWDPDFRELNLIRLFPWYAGGALAAATYMEMSIEGRLDDWFLDPIVRKTIPVIACFCFLMLVMLGSQS